MMLERRHTDRRAAGRGGGRRSTDHQGDQAFRGRKPPDAQAQEYLVVIGCRSLAGASMARFLKLWGGERVDVTLIEPDFGDCRIAVGVQGSGDGFTEYFPYDRRNLSSRYGIHVIGSSIARVDAARHSVTLVDGRRLRYDRLAVAPAHWAAGLPR